MDQIGAHLAAGGDGPAPGPHGLVGHPRAAGDDTSPRPAQRKAQAPAVNQSLEDRGVVSSYMSKYIGSAC